MSANVKIAIVVVLFVLGVALSAMYFVRIGSLIPMSQPVSVVSSTSTSGILLGAYAHTSNGSGTSTFAMLESTIGRTLALDYQYTDWGWDKGTGNGTGIDLSREEWDLQNGITPIIAWSSGLGAGTDCATAKQVAAGMYDAQLKAQAAALTTLSGNVIIDFHPEMTDVKAGDNCFYTGDQNDTSWSASDAALKASGAAYAAAEQHVVNLFKSEGAKNVQWLFAPEGNPYSPGKGGASAEVTYFYPGNAYVDWVGVDEHDGDNTDSQKGGSTFDWGSWKDFTDFYKTASVYGKPLMITQTAALANTNTPSAQYRLISTAEKEIPTEFPQIHAFVYNDGGLEDGGGDDGAYQFAGDGLTAWKAMANDPAFDGMGVGAYFSSTGATSTPP